MERESLSLYITKRTNRGLPGCSNKFMKVNNSEEKADSLVDIFIEKLAELYTPKIDNDIPEIDVIPQANVISEAINIQNIINIPEQHHVLEQEIIPEQREVHDDPLESEDFAVFRSKDSIYFNKFLSHMATYPGALDSYVDSIGKIEGVTSNFIKNLVRQAGQLTKRNFDSIKSNFHCLTPENSNNEHIIIGVSGFLSENDGPEAWKGLVQSTCLPVYEYNWESSSYWKTI